MASSVAVRKGRKHKMRLMTDNNDDQMVVKSLSVPPGLEALMEGLTREVLRMQPQDICLFASEHFAKLIKMREATGDEYQFCKTTIHDKIKQKNVPSRVTTQPNQQPSPTDDVETLDGTSSSALSVPRLDFGRLTNGVSPEIKRNRSEASTAEIDKIQAGFFDSKPAVDTKITESNEHVNTDDEIVSNKEEENGTITGVQIKGDKTEADDMKDIKPTDHDESSMTEEKDDNVAKEVNEELAKRKENVRGNTIDEDNAKKENDIQEEDSKDDKEICENVEKDAVTKERAEIPNEEGTVQQKEEVSKEELAAHDEPEESKTINIANEVEPANKDDLEAKIAHLAVTDKEAELNETEKKETGNKVEDAIHPDGAESKLDAIEEHDDLSDSNDVVTQETEEEMKTMSPADKVQTSRVEENTNVGSSVEDKPVPSSETVVEHLEDSTDAKLVDEKHDGQEEDNSTENESHTGLEKAVINDEITEKDSNKTPVHNTQAEDVKTDEVHNLTVPEISTTVATPTPSEDGSTSGDNVPKELDENVNPTGDDNATDEEKQIKAATKLQSLWRGYSLRKMRKSATIDKEDGNEEESEDLHKLTAAATVIQALWRGHSFRKSKATETSAHVAENVTSDEISPDKEAGDAADEQNIAATKIQSSWRGHNVRKKRHIDMNDVASDEEHDKKVGEVKPSEKVAENDSQEIAKEIMAATVIQALWRGYVTRKSQNLESKNESTQRNTDVDIGKLNLAAVKIQSLWRGHNYRKVQSSSTIVAEHEKPEKEMENINEKGDHEKEEVTDATTTGSELDAGRKTDTNIIESDKPQSEAEKGTDVTEPAVKAERANVTESEHIVQPSESEVNAKQDSNVPELVSEKINDTVEPEIEAEKVNDVESSKIAGTTNSEANIEGVSASPKSDLEDEKTAETSEHPEEVDNVSKTDADVPELQNKTAGSDKISDENAPENEIKSEVSETAVPFSKAEEIVKTDDGEKTELSVKANELEGEVKSEEVTEKTEPIVKVDETEGEIKSEEIVEPLIKEEENVVTAEPKIKSDEVTETSDSVVKPEEIIEATKTEGEKKSDNIAVLPEPTEPKDISGTIENDVQPGEISESEVKDEETADKVEPSVVDETTGTGESSVSDKDAPETTSSSTTAEEVKSDSTDVESKEMANKAEPIVKTNEIGETTASEAKDTETEKTLESEIDTERTIDLHEDGSAPVSENITQELAEKVEGSPVETENTNDSVEKIELHSDEKIDSIGSEVKNTEETHAIDNNVNELDEPKTTSDNEKVSETNDNDKEKIELAVIPELGNNTSDTENVEVKNAEINDKNQVEISTESPENTTITTPSEDTQSEVELASDITKNNDNLTSESPEIAVSEAAAENKEPESTVTTDEDSTEEKSTKLNENIGVKPTDIIVEDNSEQDTLTNSLGGTDSEEINKNVNADASDITETQGTINTESDTNEQIDTKENVTETVSHHPLHETQVDVVKRDEIIEPEIKKESVEVDKSSPEKTIDSSSSNQEENETELTNTIATDKSSEDQKINETDVNSTNDSITDNKDDKPSEAVESSEESNENKSGIISELEKKSEDDNQSVVKTENTDHIDTGPEISNTGTSAIEAKDNGKQDVPDGKAGQEDPVKENKGVTVNTDASDITEPHGTKSTESDTNEQIDTKENVTETVGHHPLGETQVDVDKRDEIIEPEIKKESVEVDEMSPEKMVDSSPSNQEENETEITNNIDSDKSSEDPKINETDDNSTNDSITDIKDDKPSEAVENSEVSNENESDIISGPEKKSTDGEQFLVKIENTDHVDTGPEISNTGTSAIEAKDNGKQDVPDGKVGQEDPVKGNDAATKIQSTWRGYSVRKSNNIITDGKDPETKSENNNETEESVEKSLEDIGNKTETNEDEITKPIVDTTEELRTAEDNGNESPNTHETVEKVENVPKEVAKENDATEISEPVAEKLEHSSVNSENINEAGTNDASEINKEKTVGDSSSTDENKLKDTVTNHEAVPAIKTAEVEKAEHLSNLIGNEEDTLPADETVQQEAADKLQETSPNSTDNKAENAEADDKLEDDLEKHVEMTNVEHDAKIKEENETDSRADDHKDTYQASEASTVDIKDVEDSLKSPTHAGDGNDLEINVHEDGEKLNESADTKSALDADNKVKFYVGPDESNHIQIVDDDTKEAENHVNENTESDKLAADAVTNENNKEIHKSVTSVLLSALSDDPEELEKDEATKEINDANVPETDQCIDGKKTTPADEEHQNDDPNNVSTANSRVPNSEENSNKNIKDAKEIPTENAEVENINETQDNQAQNSINNNTENIENHSVKSLENISNDENDKLNDNDDDDKQKLAMNIQNFDKELSESQNKEKESNDVEVDTDNIADQSVTDKDDTEDTTLGTDTQNTPTIPLAHENTVKTADNVVDNNTPTETVNVAPLTVEQHAVNSENKSNSVQNENIDLSPTNLHEDKSSESAINDSNDAETTQDTVEGTVTPVEQHENIEADEATTHALLNTTAKDISHKSDSTSPTDIIEESSHAADNGNNEHGSKETQHEESHTPVTATIEDIGSPHELENETPASVNDEDKHAVDKVDNVPKNVEDGILATPVGTIVEDMPHESESKSSVNDADENKNIELNETHTPAVTTTEDNQKESNEQIEHLEEKDTAKDIEENESEKLDKTNIVRSTEDLKVEGNKNSEHSEENIKNDMKNSEENEHVAVDSSNSDIEPASQVISVNGKENNQIDTTEDKDAKENVNEDNTVEKNENDLISNEENHSAVHDMKEENKNEDKPEDEIKIKDIESQIEHDITDDDAETKQNDGATENGGHNTVPLEKEVESSEGNNEKPAAVTRDDNKTEEDKAAVKIQSAWKGYHVRHGLNENKELGLLQRPAECDELPSKTDVAEDADMLSQAATTIQAGARGYLVRKRRHLAKVTEVPSEKADTTTVDESDSTSQDTVVEKQADTLDSSQSFGSIENAKSEEENAHDGTPKQETQSNEEASKATITAEGAKDDESNTLDVKKSEADGESIMESKNDNTNDNDVKKETETKDVDNAKENIAESKHETSAEINESVEETTNNNDKEELDEVGALNLRLRNLNRTNVYQTEEEKKSHDKIEEDHKTDSPKAKKMNFDRALSDLHAQTSKSSDDDESVMTAPSNTEVSHNDDANKPGDDKEFESKDKPDDDNELETKDKPDDDKELETQDKPSHEEPEAENKEVAQILEQPKTNTTPRLSVNLDDFDSSKYDLKVEHASPRSKNTSPVHELTSAAYKIGAAIAVDDEAIVDAMDENAKDKSVEKPVQYIHIPLQGPLPESVEEKPIKKERLKASQEHVTSDKNKDDGESPEYIYIPLKPPGTVEEDDEKVDEGSALKNNMEDAHTEDDNQKEETKNETGTIPRSPTENKDDNEDNLKENLHSEHLETEPTKDKEDNADTSNDANAILEDKAKEDNNSKLEDHDLSGKEHVDATEIHETLADHVIEKEGDNETEQITKIPEPIPLMNESSEQVLSNQPLLAESESSELELSHSQSPEPTHSGTLDEKSPELELSESKPTDSIVSEEPIEKLTAKENLEKCPVSGTKTPEQELSEFKSTDSPVSGQSTENLTTEKDTDKSLVEHTSTEPELSENKSTETVLPEMKNAEPELPDNTGSGELLSAKSKSPEAIDTEQQAEKSKDETSRTPSPVKSTSAIDDIDAFLQRNKSRTISRQQNVDSSSRRTLFAEIDSLIDAYGQKRQMSPTSNDHPDLASAKIENESRAQGQQLSVQDDLPDVIMANSNGADLAATKIQSAYRGYHTRQQLKQSVNRLEEVQPRKNSSESDKTYTIEKHSQDNGSTPDKEASSDDDGMKNKAAAKIQTTFREYRKKRSIEQSKSVDDEKNIPDGEQKSEKNGNEIATEQNTKDVKTEEPGEHSNKVLDEKEDKNKELEGSIENSENQNGEQQHTTSLVDVNDESVQQQTSSDEKSVTSHNTDADDNTAHSLEVHQPHDDYDSLNSEQVIRHSPEVGQVQDLKITKLEDKFLDHVVTNDSGSDAKHEQLKDISEITHDAATKIQSTYRGFKTRQTLKTDDQLDRPLDTIPEVMSPTSLDVNKEHETGEQGRNEHTDEETMNAEEHRTDHAYINGTAVQPDLKSSGDVDVPSLRQNSAEQKYKSSNVEQLGNMETLQNLNRLDSSAAHDEASTSDAWRYRLLHDATTDGGSTGNDDTTSAIRSDSTIHTEDDSEPYARASSPDGKLVQGTHRQTAEQSAGLQHSGEMHDTLDIFLSSEELSQGAEVLTSRGTSTTGDVTSAHAQSSSAAKHEAPEQHDVHSVMESAKIQSKNNTPTTQHNQQQQQHQQQQQQQKQQQTVADMGNDEAVAATKIQAGFRGYQVRKQMNLKKNGSDDAKMVKRCSSGRRRGSLRRGENPKSGTDLEERSATKIQAGIRGFLVRKRQKSTKQ